MAGQDQTTGADRVAALSQAEHVLRSNQQGWPADIVAEIATELRVAEMMFPVRCKWCGNIHDAATVTVVQRYADCSTWRCPGCNVLVDDRDPQWGGGVYQLARKGSDWRE